MSMFLKALLQAMKLEAEAPATSNDRPRTPRLLQKYFEYGRLPTSSSFIVYRYRHSANTPGPLMQRLHSFWWICEHSRAASIAVALLSRPLVQTFHERLCSLKQTKVECKLQHFAW